MVEVKQVEVGQVIDDKTAVIKEKSTLEKAEELAVRLEAANKTQLELLNRQEELMARQLLGGRTYAGQSPYAVKEETPIEYAEKVRRGEVNPLAMK